MSGLGWTANLSAPLGGEPSMMEAIWRSLRGMLGDAAGPEDGLEDLFRQGVAAALDAAAAQVEAAAFGAFPYLAQEGITLEGWEQLLAVALEATEDERRRAVAAALVARAEPAKLQDEVLARELPGVGLSRFTADEAVTTDVAVRPFGSVAYANYLATARPNYSTDFILRLAVPGALSPDEQLALRRFAVRHVPAWVDVQTIVGAPDPVLSEQVEHTVSPTGLTLTSWDDVGPFFGVSAYTRINPLPGRPPLAYTANLGGALTFRAVVGGVVGPLDAALGGALFSWSWQETPGAPPAITTAPGSSSVATATPVVEGHYALRAYRPGFGTFVLHFDLFPAT